MRSLSVSRRARWFVMMVCAAIVAGQAWQSWHARADYLQAARASSSNMARALAQHAYDSFQAADSLLLDITDRVSTLGVGSPLVADMAPTLQRITQDMPQLDGLQIYDELGRWIVNSAAKNPADASNADRAYFAYHRDHDDSAPLIGAAIRSRTTGRWVIPVSRRINHRDGSFAGVAVASLDLEYYTNLYSTFDVGPGGSISLALTNGTLLTRHPFDEKFVNKDFSDSPLIRSRLPAAKFGEIDSVSRLDGIRRVLSYHATDKYPLMVSVAVAQDFALANWRQDIMVFGIGVLLLLLMTVGFGRRLVGQIELRQDAEHKAMQAMAKLQALNHTLEKMAHQDGLTGLSNRRHFDEMLEKEYRRATRGSGSLSLVLIDVDFFKQYNDIYGHQAGDECLRQVGRLMKEMQRRPADMAVRYGGEEMLMLLPGTDSEGAVAMAERLRAGIQALAIAHRGNPAGVVTVSAGVNTISPDQQLIPPMEELLGRADAALYEAKHGGRNQVRIARATQAAA